MTNYRQSLTEAYKKVLEAFPDAELIDVQEEDQE